MAYCSCLRSRLTRPFVASAATWAWWCVIRGAYLYQRCCSPPRGQTLTTISLRPTSASWFVSRKLRVPPMQQRWHVDIDSRVVSLRLDNMDSTEIGDLLFLQDELTEDLLDAFEVHAPGALDRRASALVERFEAARLAS